PGRALLALPAAVVDRPVRHAGLADTRYRPRHLRRRTLNRKKRSRDEHHRRERSTRTDLRLVAGSPGPGRVLGQGHDVDLPAQRHVHLQLLPDRLHDGAFVPYPALAATETGRA